jgi:hypothetical protein
MKKDEVLATQGLWGQRDMHCMDNSQTSLNVFPIFQGCCLPAASLSPSTPLHQAHRCLHSCFHHFWLSCWSIAWSNTLTFKKWSWSMDCRGWKGRIWIAICWCHIEILKCFVWWWNKSLIHLVIFLLPKNRHGYNFIKFSRKQRMQDQEHIQTDDTDLGPWN